MAYEFKLVRRVQFVETDLAGIVHFTNFFRYMEATEHEFYRSIGFHIHSPGIPRSIGLPRVSLSCQFRAPLYFEDEVETQLLVREIREKTVRYAFILRRVLEDSRPIVARADLTIACVAIQDGQARMKGIPLPPNLRQKLETAPPELFEE